MFCINKTIGMLTCFTSDILSSLGMPNEANRALGNKDVYLLSDQLYYMHAGVMVQTTKDTTRDEKVLDLTEVELLSPSSCRPSAAPMPPLPLDDEHGIAQSHCSPFILLFRPSPSILCSFGRNIGASPATSRI